MSSTAVISIECETHLILGCAVCAPPAVPTTTYRPVTVRDDPRRGTHTIPQTISITTAHRWAWEAFLDEVRDLKSRHAGVPGYGARAIARDLSTPIRTVRRCDVRQALRELDWAKRSEEHTRGYALMPEDLRTNRQQRRRWLRGVPDEVRDEVQAALESRDFGTVLDLLN